LRLVGATGLPKERVKKDILGLVMKSIIPDKP
jgi:hypothetical protein